jgi:hypothetical protein
VIDEKQIINQIAVSNRRGSVSRRNRHSSPACRIQTGARGFVPAWKSHAAPTPINADLWDVVVG